MKKILVALLLFCCTYMCAGAEYTAAQNITNNAPPSAHELVRDGADNPKDIVSSLVRKAGDLASSQFLRLARSAIKIMVICAFLAIATSFTDSENQSTHAVMNSACVCLLFIVTIGDTKSVLNSSMEALKELDVFVKVLLPTFAASVAAAGKPLSAVAVSGGGMVVAQLALSCSANITVPLMYTYIGMTAVGLVGDSDLLVRGADMIKSAVMFCLKACVWCFTIYMTLSGALSHSSDLLTTKALSAVLSGTVPVVGGAMGDVAGSILQGAAVARNIVGILGIGVVLAICLAPFVSALLNMFVFKILSYVTMSYAGKKASKYLDALVGVSHMMVGLLGALCAIVFITITLAISVFGGV